MQNLQTGVAGGGTFFCLQAQEGGEEEEEEEEEGKVWVLNCLTAHSEKLHLPASNTLCCYLLLLLPTKALHSFVLDHLWIWVFARVLILRRFTRHQCTLLLPTTHQCCYLWWPTFEPSDWSNHPITGQSDLRTWVSGRTPPIRGHRRGLTDRQAKGWCFGAGSQAFLSIHLRDTDTGVKLDTNTTVQDFGQKYSYFYRSFLVFLIELDGICCAGSKSRVTLMSFQFCN